MTIRPKVYYILSMNNLNIVEMIELMMSELESSARDLKMFEMVMRTDGHISTAMQAAHRREQIEMLLNLVSGKENK